MLSPILICVGDEVDAFWCFYHLLDSMEGNFTMDQRGIHDRLTKLAALLRHVDPRLAAYLEAREAMHLYFCFRWLLIDLKREFEMADVMRLWDALWSRYRSDEFILFVCLGILEKHRMEFLQNRMGVDEILAYINNLSGRLELHEVLKQAEQQYVSVVNGGCPAELQCLVVSSYVDPAQQASGVGQHWDYDMLATDLPPTDADSDADMDAPP